ncbi:MAG: Gfo/Idh/MocA family protein [Lautropia sp.]
MGSPAPAPIGSPPARAIGPRPIVAVAGAGYFAQFHLDGWRRLHDAGAVRFAGLAEPDAGRRTAAAARWRVPQAFDDVAAMLDALRPDVLDIVTPPATHLPLVRTAVARGVACIVQKPLAPTYDEAIALVDLAAGAGVPLAIHENFRWMPWYLEMKRWLESGRLGTPHGISVRMRPGDGQGPDAYLSRQPYFQRMPRFWVHETAIHFVDTFRFLLGEVTSVSAELRRLNPVIAGEDAGTIVLRFGDGPTALIDGNRLNDHVARDTRLTMGEHWLEGSAGVLRLDGDGRLFWKPHRGAEEPHAYPWHDAGFAGDCVYRQQQHLIDAFAAGREPVNTGREYLRNYAIEEAIYQAAAERRTVDV